MKEEVVDTSVFLGALVTSDDTHFRAMALVEDMDKEEEASAVA